MFVVVLTYTQPIEIIDKLRPAHLKFLDKYYAKQIFIASGRQNPLKGGVILAANTTKEELEEIVKQDPFCVRQVATFEIIEFTPTKVNPLIQYMIKNNLK